MSDTAPIDCFWMEPTEKAARSLRRYRSGSTCTASGLGYHNAESPLSVGTAIRGEDGIFRTEPDTWPDDDPNWPTACACGYRFSEDDPKQLFWEVLYRRADTGGLVTLRYAPPGAMWDAVWMVRAGQAGPDGRYLMLRLPGGFDWAIDGPSTNGDGWNRTGEPPNITANPSIGKVDRDGSWAYHGWLRDGKLVPA